jgi:formylglycine-generating enzyme required for sulfatase activity
MARPLALLLALVIVVIAGGIFMFGLFGGDKASDSQAVADRVRSQMVFVDGGTFSAGNYEILVRLEAGGTETRWINAPGLVRDPRDVTLSAFYIAEVEATLGDHAAFAAQSDRWPDIDMGDRDPAGPTDMTWAEAQDYCAWLGEIADLPLRLPTENEWEYAARSRGVAVAYATNDGEYRPGVNLPGLGDDSALAAYPPNPLGLHNLVRGSREWVLSQEDSDPEDVRIAKGSNATSDAFFETIPRRLVADPIAPEAAKFLGERMEAVAEATGGPIYSASASVRCVAEVSAPPNVSGFGKPGGAFDPVPEAFGPYDSENRLIEG